MNKGNSADDCLPKFFKVYLPDDSGDDLAIPISFNRCLPKPLPENVIVRSIYGNIWELNLMKCCGPCGDTGKFVMVDGWKKIVKEEDLKGGEFLAFEFDGYRLFNFCIYGRTTCKRLGSSVITREMKDGSEREDGNSSVDLIVIDDGNDDDDSDDGDDFDTDQDSSGEENISNEDIIVIDDDSSDASNDDVSGDQVSGKEDQSREDIIVINDDSSGDDGDDD